MIARFTTLTRCASFEVALLRFNPEGCQRLAGGRRRRTTGFAEENVSHPEGMPARNVLASLRDATTAAIVFRWYRLAQPPANGCKPSGLNRKCATSKRASEGERSKKLAMVSVFTAHHRLRVLKSRSFQPRMRRKPIAVGESPRKGTDETRKAA
jgi:hypothetical protein